MVDDQKLNKQREIWASKILDIISNRLELRDTDVKVIIEVPVDTGMINNAKFSCDPYVVDDQRYDTNITISGPYATM